MSRPIIAIGASPAPAHLPEPASEALVSSWPWWRTSECGTGYHELVDATTGEVRSIAARCDVSGCLSCSRRFRRRALTPARYLTARGCRAYHVTLTAATGHVTSATDRDVFISSVRRLLRSAVRHGYWLGGWAVLEGVSKSGSSSISCPARAYLGHERLALAEQLSCLEGRCEFCDGLGFLPSCHLHAHLLVVVPSRVGGLWYSQAVTPDDLLALTPADFQVGVRSGRWSKHLRRIARIARLEDWQLAPGQVSLWAWLRAYGFAIADFRALNSGRPLGEGLDGQTVEYLSKVAISYDSKVASGQTEARRLAALLADGRPRGRRSVWSWGVASAYRVKTIEPDLVYQGSVNLAQSIGRRGAHIRPREMDWSEREAREIPAVLVVSISRNRIGEFASADDAEDERAREFAHALGPAGPSALYDERVAPVDTGPELLDFLGRRAPKLTPIDLSGVAKRATPPPLGGSGGPSGLSATPSGGSGGLADTSAVDASTIPEIRGLPELQPGPLLAGATTVSWCAPWVRRTDHWAVYGVGDQVASVGTPHRDTARCRRSLCELMARRAATWWWRECATGGWRWQHLVDICGQWADEICQGDYWAFMSRVWRELQSWTWAQPWAPGLEHSRSPALTRRAWLNEVIYRLSGLLERLSVRGPVRSLELSGMPGSVESSKGAVAP